MVAGDPDFGSHFLPTLQANVVVLMELVAVDDDAAFILSVVFSIFNWNAVRLDTRRVYAANP